MLSAEKTEVGKMEEESEKGRVNGYNNRDDHSYYDPCYFAKEAVNAMLKCLGLESSKETCCSEKEKKKNKYDFCHGTDEQSCAQLPVPSSTDPADPDPFLESTPPRPPITGGRDPQTNSNPSLFNSLRSKLCLPVLRFSFPSFNA